MSLLLNVTGRYSAEKLQSITNPDNPSGQSNDSTRLAYACTDAAAEFKRRTAVDYDDSNPDHVDVCVDLVILKLMERGTSPASAIEPYRSRVENAFELLAKVTGRDRPAPSSTGSLIDVQREGSQGTAYNKFDRRGPMGAFLPSSLRGS